jgi:hypothetical protein
MTVQPLHSQMSKRDVMDRLAGPSNVDLPMVDARTGRMIGVFANNKSR